MIICPIREVDTFFETRLAVGLFLYKCGHTAEYHTNYNALVNGNLNIIHIINLLYTAIGKIKNRSIYRYWKSPKVLPNADNNMTERKLNQTVKRHIFETIKTCH